MLKQLDEALAKHFGLIVLTIFIALFFIALLSSDAQLL